MKKGEQGLATPEVLNHTISGITHISYFLFVDLAAELSSNWYGGEAIRNQVPVEYLIGVTARQDPTTTHPIVQQGHSVLCVAAPWSLHAW